MANLLSIQNISLSFGGQPVLDNVSLNIAAGDRICLVGRNGCGKSSLLKVIDGSLEPDSGKIIRQPSLKIASLPQEVSISLEGTVAEIVGNGAATPSAQAAAAAAITRLGLDRDAPFSSLSGGQRRRCLLARAIASQADLLVLDEPTNHLDIETIEWLEGFLESRITTFIFVTHDRAFLRRLAKRIVDLDRGKLNGWDCDYDTFLNRKAQLIEDENTYYERLGKNIRREEAWLRRGVKARTARNEGRVNALMELRRQFAARRVDEGLSNIRIQASDKSGVRVLRIKDISFSYPKGKTIVSHFSADVLRGERIALVGKNGVGKTTLVKLITGELQPDLGEIACGTNLKVVYFDQLRETINPELSVAENVAESGDNVTVDGRQRHVLSYLSDFLFSPDRAKTPAKALSGGERGRLALAKLFLQPCNFLILDEPTNDLDAETLDLLEDQIAAFGGTVIVISHDRDFIDNTATCVWVFGEDGEISAYPGGYGDLLDRRKEEEKRIADAATDARASSARQDRVQSATPQRQAKLTYREKEEYEALPGKIEALEAEEAELNKLFCDPELFRKPAGEVSAMKRRLGEIPHEIEKAMARWAELADSAG